MRSGKARQQRLSCQSGFGYLLMLFALGAIGLLLAGTGQVWHTNQQREKEIELLFIGNQFRQALRSYRQFTPDATQAYPLRLEDLLEDRRSAVPRRHLRRIYRDPITGSTQWGLVKSGDRIVGVHSLSGAQPLKNAFRGMDAVFGGTSRYEQWVFSYDESSAKQ
jgi:type II secretory pathway pseudopilin PulG